MATYILVHGGWHGGWCWIKVVPLLRNAGHDVFAPTLTGLGERKHLLDPEIDLYTHIQDVMGILEYEDLNNVILVGHSYGGMVVTGVSDMAASRLSHLVYLDAFVPQDAQALRDLFPGDRDNLRRMAEEAGDGWKVPVGEWTFGVTADADLQWMLAKLTPHPLKTIEQPIRLKNQSDLRVPRTYILCRKDEPDPRFDPFAEQARRRRWGYYELSTGHDAMITAPEELTNILLELA